MDTSRPDLPKNDSPALLHSSFEKIKNDLRNFINLSLQEDERSWTNWISSVAGQLDIKCWERKHCEEHDCPAYHNTCGRCWIIAGTMCGSREAHGKFAQKYQSCKECEIYQEAVYRNPVSEIEEHLIILVHSLRSKQLELHEVATTDFLTGLYNRRFIDSYLAHEQEKLKRNNNAITLMVIDINGFKRINDTCGHTAGDHVLKECARILLSCTRKSDVVARYGGDEFVVALHECGDQQSYAQALIARIEAQVTAWNAIGDNGRTAISLSFGSAALGKDDVVAEVIKRADQAMYTDKMSKKRPAPVPGTPPTSSKGSVVTAKP